MADGRRSKEVLEPLDETYWGEWELYEVCGGFEHVGERELERFEEMVAESKPQ